jgi:DNA-binding transcriptional ArsR family regulator
MSHHFRVLRDAGLVHTRNVGTTHMNSLRSQELNLRFPGLLDCILSQA